ncbi:AraC-type DNA-binding protein [Mucilaginibacter lappiensis]|uniref:AraC-like DNA-binding protein n=1 Tax=Mucilaginibacter lappiensis TaxID=354630 RepID=A0ABR6PD29_9SPHI|nr:AraC family transcriptional regulator [Mucilaginibacter lappiensis]MBB6107658.1 AraC-like DNA-binding protein [Mucilaginibacter lappiensis]SIQ01414.1 AraC-type DNA-binding protein [Mucilaginibacter lappiensis]
MIGEKAGLIEEFAAALGVAAKDNTITIPKSKGGGFITFMRIEGDFRVMIGNYYLKEQMVMERINKFGADKYILFSFNDVFEPFEKSEQVINQYQQPKVAVFSETVSSVLTFPSHTFFRSIYIAVNQRYLQNMTANIRHPIIARIAENKEHFAFESNVTAAMIKCANDLISENVNEGLEALYFKIKCEELLCYLFNQLMGRKDESVSKFHIDDIKAVYKIKDYLRSHLATAPNIAKLAVEASMSETKLRKLFKQTFGKGVFEYYQSLRMQEAARLLKDERLTVSEVGFRLGFTNLSHFSRVFEGYIGMKPKKWSVAIK